MLLEGFAYESAIVDFFPHFCLHGSLSGSTVFIAIFKWWAISAERVHIKICRFEGMNYFIYILRLMTAYGAYGILSVKRWFSFRWGLEAGLWTSSVYRILIHIGIHGVLTHLLPQAPYAVSSISFTTLKTTTTFYANHWIKKYIYIYIYIYLHMPSGLLYCSKMGIKLSFWFDEWASKMKTNNFNGWWA